jgi:mannose-6-phosphate isomerase-like protein (cupin superfamily)
MREYENMSADVPVLLSRNVAVAKTPDAGRLSAMLMRHGSMEMRWYTPKWTDPQEPHDRDEIYVVIAGCGWFVRGQERVTFGPGDALFVPAGQSHRFEDFTPDLAAWVIFYGPAGEMP